MCNQVQNRLLSLVLIRPNNLQFFLQLNQLVGHLFSHLFSRQVGRQVSRPVSRPVSRQVNHLLSLRVNLVNHRLAFLRHNQLFNPAYNLPLSPAINPRLCPRASPQSFLQYIRLLALQLNLQQIQPLILVLHRAFNHLRCPVVIQVISLHLNRRIVQVNSLVANLPLNQAEHPAAFRRRNQP